MKLSLFFCLFLFFFIPLTIISQADSLELQLPKASQAEKIGLYKKLTIKYSEIKLEKAFDYARQGLALVNDSISKDAGFFYLLLGKIANEQGNPQQALRYYNKTLEVAQALNYELGIAKSFQNIGVTHIRMGHYEKALKHYLDALNIYQKHNKNELVIGILNNLGTLHSCHLKNNQKAKTYFEQALDLTKNNDDHNFKSYILTNIGEMYLRQEAYEKATASFSEALSLAKKENNIQVIVNILKNLSTIHLAKEEYPPALQYAQESLEIREKAGFSLKIALEYLHHGNIYEKLGNNTTALHYYLKAQETALKIHSTPQLVKTYEALHRFFKKTKQFEKGYHYLCLYTRYKDSLFTTEKSKQLQQIQTKFDVENKQKEVQLLTNSLQIKELQNQQQQTAVTTLIIGLLASVFILSTAIFAYIHKRKISKALEEKNKKIATTLQEREILLKEVHHRVKNNLQIVASLINLQHEFGNKTPPQEVLQKVQDKIEAMVIIHENLYKKGDLSSISFKTYIERLSSYFKTSYALSEQGISITTDVVDTPINIDTLVPCGLILNEIISNSIKHAFPPTHNGAIMIKASLSDQGCTLAIKDNGIGFPKDFDPTKHKDSLGMQLIKGLSKQIKGTLSITSDKGTTYTLSFPLSLE